MTQEGILKRIEDRANHPSADFLAAVVDDVFKKMEYPEGLVYWHFNKKNELVGIYDKVLNFDGTVIVSDKEGYIYVNGEKTEMKIKL